MDIKTKAAHLVEELNRCYESGGYTTFINHIGEKDQFWDPYKKDSAEEYEHAEPLYLSDENETNMWLRKLTKDLDFNNPEDLNKAASRYQYYSDDCDLFGCDLYRDDRISYLSLQQARKRVYKAIMDAVDRLNLSTESEGGTIPDNNYLARFIRAHKKSIANADAAAKRRATTQANYEANIDTYKAQICDMLNSGEYGVPSNSYGNIFTTDGDLTARGTWGWIKDGNDELHKVARKLWIAKWGKK